MLPMGAPGSGGSPAWIQGQTFSRTVLGITALPVYYPSMATFLVRLESHDVRDYVPLHEAMNERRFNRALARVDETTFGPGRAVLRVASVSTNRSLGEASS